MRSVFLSAIVGLLPFALLAHGEDKLGPNGGYIRMPGGFHTEIKMQGKDLLVYLLDINWKNPVVKNSSIKADYINGGKTSTLSCSPKLVEFSCSLPSGFNSTEGKLVVVAERDGLKGSAAEYPLPLKLNLQEKPASPSGDDHSKHH